MKLVINKCYGGFSLSPKAVKRMAELQGRKCFFFKHDHKTNGYIGPLSEDEVKGLLWTAFDIDNPNEVLRNENWSKMTSEERTSANDRYRKHDLTNRPEDRADPLLIKVVEELGEEADGACAQLGIVEIPDGVEWELSEYDGIETVHEKHRRWE